MALLLQLFILVQVVLQLVHLTLLLLALGTLTVRLVLGINIFVFVTGFVAFMVMEDSLEETLMLVLVAGIGLCINQSQEQTTNTSDWSTHYPP